MKKQKALLLIGLLSGVLAFGASGTAKIAAGANTGNDLQPIAIQPPDNAHQAMRKNGWLKTDFDAIRINVETPLNDQYNSATNGYYQYATAHLGLGTVDLTNAVTFKMKTRGVSSNEAYSSGSISGTKNTRIRWFVIDEDGDTLRYEKANGDSRKFYSFIGDSDGLAEPTDQNYAWQGTWVGGLSGILTGGKAGFGNVYNNDYYTESGADGTFDWSKVTTFYADVLTYGPLTIDVGSLSVVMNDGTEQVLFDMTAATEAESYVGLEKNEWWFGPTREAMSKPNTTKEGLATLGTTAEYIKVYEEGLMFKGADGVTDSWTAIYKDDVTALDFTGYDGFTFDLDTTGANSTTKVTFLFRYGGTEDYKAFGNQVKAWYAAEDGTLSSNAEYGKGCNVLPAGFKGKVIVPFGAFEKSGALMTARPDYSNITMFCAIAEAAGFTNNDVAKISNIQVIANAEAMIGSLKVNRVKNLINDLPADEITAENRENVKTAAEKARTAYDALSDSDKEQIDNYDKLVACELGVQITEASFMLRGASIRLKNSDVEGVDKNAIRFAFVMEKTVYDKAAALDGVQFGTLLIPETTLNGEVLDVNTPKAIKTDVSSVATEITIENVEYVQFIVSLYNIPDAAYASEVRAIGFVGVNGYYYYSTSDTRSIRQVAIRAYDDVNASSAVKELVKKYLPDYAVTFSDGNASVSRTVTYGAYALPELMLTPPDGKQFSHYEVDGKEYAVGDTLQVTGAVHITVVWKDA